MALKDWKKHYDEILDKKIDNYLKEQEDNLIDKDPYRSKEDQIAKYRESLQEVVHSKKAEEIIANALELISHQMPLTVSKETWDLVYHDFSHCEAKLVQYLENSENSIVPIYKMCGLSLETVTQCYAFGQNLFNKKEYANCKSVMLFLMQIEPQIPEFWISAAMCDKKLENYNGALELYKLAETVFPENPAFFLYYADVCFASGDLLNAKIQLESAKKLIEQDANVKFQWQATYDYLVSKLNS